jgi:molybdopterin converting factor small subunit
VTVLLFARPREVVGKGRVDLELPDNSNAGDAFAVVAEGAPALLPMKGRLRAAVGGEYAGWDTPLFEGAELALIPPTAGG